MDDNVLRGMARWPDVPAVYGWLALDRRGQWLLRGERIGNALARAFIDRNYAGDACGRWYFQNGPQRVFVDLACTPYVYRLSAGEHGLRFVAHTGAGPAGATSAWMDEEGSLYVATALGVGLVDDRDLGHCAERIVGAGGDRLADDTLEARLEQLRAGKPGQIALDTGEHLLELASVGKADLGRHFGFDPTPRPAARENAGT